MIALTLAELAQVTGGTVHGDPAVVVDGPVVTDAREAAAGSLYVARVGEHADGHAYVPRPPSAARAPPSPPDPSTGCRASSSRTPRPPSSP